MKDGINPLHYFVFGHTNEEDTYKSEDPVSKFMSSVWPPIVTGETNSMSPSIEVAVTAPVLFEAAALAFFVEADFLLPKGSKSLASTPFIFVASIPNLRYALRSAAGPAIWFPRLTWGTLKDRP